MFAFAVAGSYYAGRYLWAEHYYRAAERALERRDFGQAQAHLALCLKARPRHAATHLLAARAARSSGEFEAAERYLDSCQELGGTTAAVALERALLDVQRGRLAGKEQFLMAHIQQHPADTVLVLEALTQGYIQTGRHLHALICLERWLQQEPDAVQALLWQGEEWEQTSHEPEALTAYHRILALDPGQDAARLRLAQLLLRGQHIAEAAGHFELLQQRQPGNSAALVGLARCLYFLGQPQRARTLVEMVLTAHPQDDVALLERGRLSLEAKELQDAERWLRKAVMVTPYAWEANVLLAQCLQRLGKPEEAEYYLGQWRRIAEDQARLTNLAKQVAEHPQDPALRYQGGMILLRMGATNEGLRWLVGALQEDPLHPETHEAVADYYAERGDPAKATEHRQLALRGRNRNGPGSMGVPH